MENEKELKSVEELLNLELSQQKEQKKELKGKGVIKDVGVKEINGLKKMFLIVNFENKFTIEIDKVIYLKDKKITVSGLWITLDDLGKVKSMSGLGRVMKYLNVENVMEMLDKQIEIETIENKIGVRVF